MPKLRWLSGKGDSVIDFKTRAETKQAKKKFKALQKEGHAAFTKATDGKLTPVKRFTKRADEIIMVPLIAGG